MTYSNVTEEEIGAIISLLKSQQKEEIKLPERLAQGKPLVCKYATDTGVRAFVKLPCRGNRIICSKLEGHTSYSAACNPGNCKYFEQRNEKEE